MYIGMWKDARRVDGPNSRLARLFRRLANLVRIEMQMYKMYKSAAA
jgi:hypothetical protein